MWPYVAQPWKIDIEIALIWINLWIGKKFEDCQKYVNHEFALKK